MTAIALIGIILGCLGTHELSKVSMQHRALGFAYYCVANLMWIAYGVYTENWLIVLQFVLFFAFALRGMWLCIHSEVEDEN